MHFEWIVVVLGSLILNWLIRPRERQQAALLLGFAMMAVGIGLVAAGLGGKGVIESLMLDGLVSAERMVMLGYSLMLLGIVSWRRPGPVGGDDLLA